MYLNTSQSHKKLEKKIAKRKGAKSSLQTNVLIRKGEQASGGGGGEGGKRYIEMERESV